MLRYFIRPMGALVVALVVLTAASVTPVIAATWNPPPTVFRDHDVVGIGFIGISSGFRDGVYVDSNGVTQTANVSMASTATQISAKIWRYMWTLTNSGTGDFVSYVDTGGGPNFLQFSPLKAGQSQTDTRLGGRPVIGQWGGGWNPQVGPAAARLEPSAVPLSSSASLLFAGLGSFAWFSNRRRATRAKRFRKPKS